MRMRSLALRTQWCPGLVWWEWWSQVSVRQSTGLWVTWGGWKRGAVCFTPWRHGWEPLSSAWGKTSAVTEEIRTVFWNMVPALSNDYSAHLWLQIIDYSSPFPFVTWGWCLCLGIYLPLHLECSMVAFLSDHQLWMFFSFLLLPSPLPSIPFHLPFFLSASLIYPPKTLCQQNL